MLRSFLRAVLAVTLVVGPAHCADAPVGSDTQIVEMPVKGFTPLRLTGVTLCRFSDFLGGWIAEFKATREVTKGQYIESQITLHARVTLRDGSIVPFDVQQSDDGTFYADNHTLYKASDVKSFLLTADTSWAAQDAEDRKEAAAARRAAAAAAKVRADRAAKSAEDALKLRVARESCRTLYSQTADKKVAELTVREEHEVDACTRLGFYGP